ncbi:hypothetical protein XELAEV_18002300mg [Xenopus laevis]|nr:hypothetical protein XELAEV_18002300mg [Xenopus laevis]
MESTICSNNYGNITNPEISPVEQPPPTNGIKEEEASWEERNQSDCSIYPLTEQIQGTDTPTPIMGYSLNNTPADDYILVVVKEEEASWEEEKQLAEQTQATDTSTLMGQSKNSSLFIKDTSDGINDDLFLMETDHNYCKINTITGQILQTDKQNDSVAFVIKEEPASCEWGNQSECNEYHQNFSYNRDFDKHEKPHNTEKTFSCLECGKCFPTQSRLKAHHRIHTGKKPFSCTECGKCYSCQADLKNHHRTHTGEKPFSCTECGKCFSYQADLKNHHRTHTGEKPFSCSECGKRFARENSF